MTVRLADRTERDLGDLGAAADDDDPLAEDSLEGPGQVDPADVLEAVEQRDEPAGTRRTVESVRTRPPADAITVAIAGIASGRST